ncbi:MAG: class I SAM-dependent methyltransferase [bacterium]
MSHKGTVVDFLRYPHPCLPSPNPNILGGFDASAIVSRILVKTLGVRSRILRQNIWRHEAGRGRLFARTYAEIVGLEAFKTVHLLEIGCGPGAVAGAFFELGCSVRAMDLRDGRIFWHPDIEFARGDACQYQEARIFDVVSLTSVLHHIGADDAALIIGKVRSTLCPGGLLLMQEDILGPRSVMNLLIKTGDDLVSGEVGTHQAESHRTTKEWVTLVTELGFSLVGTKSLFPNWLGVGVEKAFFVFEKV